MVNELVDGKLSVFLVAGDFSGAEVHLPSSVIYFYVYSGDESPIINLYRRYIVVDGKPGFASADFIVDELDPRFLIHKDIPSVELIWDVDNCNWIEPAFYDVRN